jgi:hypothetical protein
LQEPTAIVPSERAPLSTSRRERIGLGGNRRSSIAKEGWFSLDRLISMQSLAEIARGMEWGNVSCGAIFHRATTDSCFPSHIIDLFHRIHRWHQTFELSSSTRRKDRKEERVRVLLSWNRVAPMADEEWFILIRAIDL